MIKKPTVLVLGAGASMPYGFPSGQELVQKICDTLNSDHPETASFSRRLQALDHDPGHVNDFVNELRRARPNSIDGFLETRSEFRDVGKAAIADVLLRAEANSVQRIQTINADHGDWYTYLLNAILLSKGHPFFQPQARLLSIVTFNFDRSLEWCVFERVTARFGLSATAASELTRGLQIFHVHGLLGEPSWLVETSHADATGYGAASDDALIDAVRIAVKRIKLVDEEIDQTVVEGARGVLSSAHSVYFMGFGFDERNLRKLNAPLSVGMADVRGTVKGHSQLEQRLVGRYFGTVNKIRLVDTDTLGFLRNHAERLFD